MAEPMLLTIIVPPVVEPGVVPLAGVSKDVITSPALTFVPVPSAFVFHVTAPVVGSTILYTLVPSALV